MAVFPGYLVSTAVPSRIKVVNFTRELMDYLFPVVENDRAYRQYQEQQLNSLQKQLFDILTPISHATGLDVLAVSEAYFEGLPRVKEQLLQDARLILEFDPAAYSIEEVILSYPGFTALIVHRLAHRLFDLEVAMVPRMMSEWAHSKTGIDIHPGAQIGTPFMIDHGTGVVIGETSVIGRNVKIYQGVTLGALAVRKQDAKTKRHPTIEDNVVIYAGSTILGGDTVIGHNSIIGGNTWITESIPPFSIVYHQHQTLVRDRREHHEPINFII